MAGVRGFRGSRFTAEAGPLSRLIAPPSALVPPEERERLAAEPNNIVHATMPPSDPDDRSKFVRYARASAQLSAWRRGGLLCADDAPALYRSGSPGGGATLLAVVPLAAILPGEAAPPREREDRLRMLEATRTYLEPVPLAVAVADPDPRLPPDGSPDGSELLAILDAAAQETLLRALAGAVFRAGGRGAAAVDAARAFRAVKGERAGPVAEDFVLAAIGPDAERVPSGLVLWSLADFKPGDFEPGDFELGDSA